MTLRNGRYLTKFKFQIENISPFNIGNGDGEPIIDYEENKVYLPGTTMAGAFRDYLERSSCKECDYLFGNNGDISKVFTKDSYSNLLGKEIRESNCIDGQTGTSDNKFSRVYVKEGHKFNIEIDTYANLNSDMEKYTGYVKSFIKAINNKEVTFGSYKSVGGGLFKVNCVKQYKVDLENKDELFNYLLNRENYITLDINNSPSNSLNKTVIFKLEGYVQNLLIKGVDSLDCDKVDSTSYKSNGKYIIPGSSLKGVIKGEALRILNYFNLEEDINKIFGGEIKDKKIASAFKALDTTINNVKTKKYNRIKINKFTGGTLKGNLLEEETVSGDVKLQGIMNLNNLQEKYIGLLAMTFRDIGLGKISLGSGNSIGRGIVFCKKLTIRKNNEIIFEGNILENNIKINRIDCYINELVGGEI